MMNTLIKEQTGTGFRSEIRDGAALLELARGWLKQGNPVVAVELLKSAIDTPEAADDRRIRASVLKETGRALMMQSDWGNSEPYYIEAQRVFLDIEDYRGASECARNRANMSFQRGQYRHAEELCEQALGWSSTINDHELRATILNTMAAVKSATGDTRGALKTFKLCLADFQAVGNVIRQGYVLLNIGLTEIDLHDYNQAIASLNDALAIALNEKDLHLVEICYQHIARCYLEQKETILAKSVIDTARKILPGLNSKALEVELSVIDCRILRAMGDFETAEAQLVDSYHAAVEHNLAALQADLLFEQGLLYRDTGRLEQAESKLNAAAQQYRQLGVDAGFKEAIQEIEHLKRRTDR
ncbi:tetratricopeptide repeat protein [candidate division GN15 bacterium]|nr:tetratricopeptide repeat protein [candidate division GN15 bacterium]